MNVKEYLGQAYRINQHIDSKLEQLSSLNLLAKKATSTISDMPGSPNRNIHKMENIIVKIVDLENEINGEIDSLVDLKAEQMHLFRQVKDKDCALLLELRYLCFRTWEDIALDFDCTVRNVHMIHKKALQEVKKLKAFH